MSIEASKTAFVFPGQGSQFIGMGLDLAKTEPIARQIFEEADQVLGFALSDLAWYGPEDDLNDTLNTQPALLTHSAAVLHVFLQRYPGFKPAFVAGHSMGELSALVAGKALSFAATLPLVRRRGELMKHAGEVSPGGMAAILGLDIPTLDALCAEASAPGEIVQVANDNCPGQVVISGAAPALQRAVQLAQQAGARRAVTLAVSIAAHSPLMLTSQEAFNSAVQSAPIQAPEIPIIGNVSAQPLRSAEQVRQDLQGQLTSRVRWTETIQFMISQGINTFIEVGSGSVLNGLIKRVDRSAICFALGSPADFDKLEA